MRGVVPQWGAVLDSKYGIGSAILIEMVFTALLVFAVLSTTTVGYPTGLGGLAVGLTLTMIHLATIPVDNTSVNPARSSAWRSSRGPTPWSSSGCSSCSRSSARCSVPWCGCSSIKRPSGRGALTVDLRDIAVP
jgi:glycerol uptake facilitator-like aquaporin